MTHASLFSGIGGFDLAARWAGIETLFTCEIDAWCREVLQYHFPKAQHYEDIKKTDFRSWRGAIDIISGGFPCHPFSVAGKQRGKRDARYLWGEMLRCVREVRPQWVIAENVYGLLTTDFGLVFAKICADLENNGYSVQPYLIPACAAGSPQLRNRLWIVAYDDRKRSKQRERQEQTIQPVESPPNREGFNYQSLRCSRTDGLPVRLDGTTVPRPLAQWRKRSLQAYGNAIVPQVARILFETIKTVENEPKNNRNTA